MTTARLRVDADKSVHLEVADDLTQHPDLGSALVRLSRVAKVTHSPVLAVIEDSNGTREVHIDEAGRITAPTEPASTSGAGGAAESNQTSPASSSSGPGEAGSVAARDSAGDSRDLSDADRTAGTHAADQPSAAGAVEDGSELATPYSGPAKPQRTLEEASKKRTERARKREARTQQNTAKKSSAPRKPARSRARPKMRGMTVPGLVLAVLLIGALGAYFIPTIIGSPGSSAPESISPAGGSTAQTSLKISDTDDPVPGYSGTPRWESKISTTASVTASTRGVLVIDGNKLTVLDPITGTERYGTSVSQRPSFAVDTKIGDRGTLLWRIGNEAFALFDGEKAPIAYTLPNDARLSSAGTSVLIKSGNDLFTFADTGLNKLATPPPGSTPMAVDGPQVFSAEFAGPLIVTDGATGKSNQVTLEKPGDGLKVIRWVSAGHGKVVTLWGVPGSTTSSGHKIQLVVSDASSGKIASTVTTTTDSVGEANWIRGQGYLRAVIGPYLFNMEDGLLVHDGSGDDVRFSEPRGTLVPTTVDGVATILEGDTAWRTETNLLAIAGTDAPVAVVRLGADRIGGYPRV